MFTHFFFSRKWDMQTNNLIQGQKILKVSYFSSWPLWHNKTPSLWCMFLCAGICFETLPNAYTRTKIEGFWCLLSTLKSILFLLGDLFSTKWTCMISRKKSWKNAMQAKKWKRCWCFDGQWFSKNVWNQSSMRGSVGKTGPTSSLSSILICLHIYYIRQVPLSWLK